MRLVHPPFPDFPELATPRLTLRALCAADMLQILSISYFHGKPAGSLEEAHQMQRLIEAEYQAGESVHWGLALAEAPAIIVGSAGFYRGFANSAGEIGYVLLPAYQGRGYATEAVGAIARFGFAALELRQITAVTDLANAASAAVLRRAGSREMPVGEDPATRQFRLDRP